MGLANRVSSGQEQVGRHAGHSAFMDDVTWRVPLAMQPGVSSLHRVETIGAGASAHSQAAMRSGKSGSAPRLGGYGANEISEALQLAQRLPAQDDSARLRHQVLGVPVDEVSPSQMLQRISAWGRRHESRYVCITNVHSVITANHDPSFHRTLSTADTVTPDGEPVAWMLRRLGAEGQVRVNGPDLMADYFDVASCTGESVFLYGGDEVTLAALMSKIERRWPNLRVAGAISPPFRDLTPEEDEAVVRQINASGAQTVWVSLGCPKQERWMAAHRGRINAVMIGVGAAFSFHAGTIKRAPEWMRRNGLEWLHRLASEPRRLWKRYLTTNSAFVVGAARQLLRQP
jgi:N-acetylglucosaminyldiphosphoundecaprenol N-acetyl-beta-D-mannosaminyltransferase